MEMGWKRFDSRYPQDGSGKSRRRVVNKVARRGELLARTEEAFIKKYFPEMVHNPFPVGHAPDRRSYFGIFKFPFA